MQTKLSRSVSRASIDMDKKLHKKLKLLAIKEGKTIKQLVVELIENRLNEVK